MGRRRALAILVAGCLAGPVPARAQTGAVASPSPPGGRPAPVRKLTPVQPVPLPAAPPAYQLYFEIDVPILTIGVVFALGRAVRTGLAPAYCAPTPGSPMEESTFCNPSDLNWLDRHLAGRYEPRWITASDVGVLTVGTLTAVGMVGHEGFRRGLNDLVVIAEATLLANAAAGASTAMIGRPRPFMYGLEAPLEIRQGGNGALSYFSAHTATSFAAVTAAFVTLRRLHPEARWPWLVLGGGVLAAGFVGTARVLAGYHFPTDVMAGAAVGGAFGVLVPALHAAPGRLGAAPLALADGGGVALFGRWP